MSCSAVSEIKVGSGLFPVNGGEKNKGADRGENESESQPSGLRRSSACLRHVIGETKRQYAVDTVARGVGDDRIIMGERRPIEFPACHVEEVARAHQGQ